MEALQKGKYYTYEDYCSWGEDVRAEIIDGTLVMMSPPLRTHQSILMELSRQLANFLRGKQCKVFPAPFGVYLSEDEDTVLEPDITVVCDKSKLGDRGCNGAPDMVAEILSPSSARIDRLVKFQKYQKACVREYWIVDPETKTVQININENGRYFNSVHGDTDTVPVHVLDGCQINLQEVFEGL